MQKYAYETRLLAKLENQNLFETEKEEKLTKEVKKIICLKSGGAYYGSNYGPFLHYKESLESDIQELNSIAAQLDFYDIDSHQSIMVQEQVIHLLASLDHIFDAIYLDFEVVRDMQLTHMAGQIKSLESDKNQLALALKEQKEQQITVVVNNTTPDQTVKKRHT